MCYSIEVEKELKKIAKLFKAEISESHYDYYEKCKFRAEDKDWLKRTLNLKRKPTSNPFKDPDFESRVYPGYFAPVIKSIEGQRLICPMRYRVRPNGSQEEIPTKFNVFNARLDSLMVRQTWRPLIGRKHGVVPFKKFFEWVPGPDGKPKLISFNSKDHEIMWAPCLWDQWESPNKELSFYSFAIITTEPNPEILEKGHDRSPIFLKENKIDEWLTEKNTSNAIKLLSEVTQTYYLSNWV